MNVLSLFDGISCGMVALQRAGIHVDEYYASEIDENAIAISKKNHPNIIRLGDVTKWKEWNLPKIDLLIGGSPCQGFSRNGKCLNFDDPRSKLFFEFAEILNHLKAINPEIKFLLENVKMKNEWADVISEYVGVEPIEINSSLVSGQNRSRMYWTNIEGVEQPEDKGIDLVDILEDDLTIPCFERYELLIDNSISDASANLVNVVDGEVRITQAVKGGYIVAEDGDGINLQFPTSKTRRGRVIKKKSSTLDCSCDICVFHNGMIRKFTITELERLQTLPDGYTEGFTETAAKKAIGNGWTVDVIAHILKNLKNERGTKQMEMKVNEYQLPEKIDFNYEELKQELIEKVSMYETLVYTEENIKDAKADRENLNKLKKALNDERIRREKEYMVPFNDFKTKINEIISIIDKPVVVIDKQVKEYEEKQKQDKLDAITALFNSTEHPEWLHISQIFDEKWLNASASMKSVQETMNERLDQIEIDLTTLHDLPEFGFEASEVYKTSLDINKAISEAQRMSQIAKAKAEAEAKKATEATSSKMEQVEPQPQPAQEGFMNPPVEEKPKQWIKFQAYMTVDDAFALKQFFNSRNIEYKAV